MEVNQQHLFLEMGIKEIEEEIEIIKIIIKIIKKIVSGVVLVLVFQINLIVKLIILKKNTILSKLNNKILV
jgi:hypothetical protein